MHSDKRRIKLAYFVERRVIEGSVILIASVLTLAKILVVAICAFSLDGHT